MEKETIDDFLGGELKIIQKANGYRFSVDALLLSSFADIKKGDDALELGAGSGIICMLLAKRGQAGSIVGIEIQEEMAAMARRSVAMNGLTGYVEIIAGDIRNIECLCRAESFDMVLFNPPYRKINSGRINPDQQKAIARHELKGTLDDFLKAAKYGLKKSGRACLIYPASRMVELLSRMRSASIEPKKLRVVYSRRNMQGEFVLAEGAKGGKEELAVLSPLYIYEDNGEYTTAMKELFTNLSSAAG